MQNQSDSEIKKRYQVSLFFPIKEVQRGCLDLIIAQFQKYKIPYFIITKLKKDHGRDLRKEQAVFIQLKDATRIVHQDLVKSGVQTFERNPRGQDD